MEYVATQEYTLPEYAGWENPVYEGAEYSHTTNEGKAVYTGRYVLQPDELLYDGDIEPDIMASLFAGGVIERTDGVSWGADPDEPDPDEPDPDAPDDEDEDEDE